MKTAVRVLFPLCLLPLLLPAQPRSIYIVKSKEAPPFQAAVDNFKAQIRLSGISAEYSEFNLETAAAAEIIAAIRGSECDLILTVGSAAVKELSAEIKDVPIVFTMILNPVSTGILSKERPGGSNLTGVTLDIPLDVQFQYLQRIIPDARTIGVLYDPRHTGAMIAEATRQLQALGLRLVSIDVTDEKNVPDAVDKITRSVDVLWLIADQTVISPKSTEHLLMKCLYARVPVMGLSSSYVEAGALFALSADYQDIGGQSAEIAKQILQGKSPSNIALAAPRKIKLAINLSVAAQLGIPITEPVRTQASEVFGE